MLYIIQNYWQDAYWTGQQWDTDLRLAKRFMTQDAAEGHAYRNCARGWAVLRVWN
jgi:hypothetical protein